MAVPPEIEGAPLAVTLAIGIIFLLFGFFVIITFLRNKELRAYPAVLVFSRACCNFSFGLVLFAMIAFIVNGQTCSLVGSIWFALSVASDAYFAALAYDLYATLSNPFRHVADAIKIIHILVWAVSISLVVVLALTGNFSYRTKFGICFTTQTKNFSDFNWANAAVIYVPNGLSNACGILALFYAYRRMRVGLDGSWELRQKVINEMLVLAATFSINSLVIFFIWMGVFYVPSLTRHNSSSAIEVFILMTTTFPSRALADAVAWFFLKYFPQLKESLECCQNSCNCIERSDDSTPAERLRFSRTFIELEPEEHVSVALRQEVIEYMKVGITTTLERAQSRTRRGTQPVNNVEEVDHKADEPTEPPPSSDLYPVGMDDRDEKRVDYFDIATQQENSVEVPFVDYAPHVFRYLRKHVYHKSDVEYRISIDEGDADSIARTNFVDGGRSGAFLFFTGDQEHLIKTLTTEELKFCLKILPEYVKHLANNQGRTLITKFYGLHSLEMYDIKIHFIVMDNVFVSGKNPDQKYDLKGSWVARHTNHHVEAGKLMKDEDFRTVLRLEESQAIDLFRTMKYDSEFLATQNIMDYSLLLGTYYEDVERGSAMQSMGIPEEAEVEPQDSENKLGGRMRFDSDHVNKLEMQDMSNSPVVLTPGAKKKSSKLNAGDFEHMDQTRVFRAPRIYGPGTYCMGIIDILAEYGWFKRAERFAKTYLLCADPDGISVNPPERYQARFLEFMGRRVLGLTKEQMEEIL